MYWMYLSIGFIIFWITFFVDKYNEEKEIKKMILEDYSESKIKYYIEQKSMSLGAWIAMFGLVVTVYPFIGIGTVFHHIGKYLENWENKKIQDKLDKMKEKVKDKYPEYYV